MTEDGDLILLAEDDDNLRYLTMRQLKKLGFAAHYAVNGKEAVAMVEQYCYRAILMDIMMPQMDGCMAARVIRQFEQEAHRQPVPIIAMTAYQEKVNFLDAGMSDYLFKPVLLADLEQKLKLWLS